MNPFQTPGAMSWAELMTSDAEAAVRFYGELLGWQIKGMPMEGMGTYHVCSVPGHDDQPIGGICNRPPQEASQPPTWGVYATVADVEATVARCTALGGTVCAAPFDVPGVGRMAVLQDPQGAVFQVMQYEMPA